MWKESLEGEVEPVMGGIVARDGEILHCADKAVVSLTPSLFIHTAPILK